MAEVAETAGTRLDFIEGNMRGVKADLTSVGDGETWTPGLAIIEHFMFTPSTAAGGTQWGVTISSPVSRRGVVTFVLEGAALEGKAIAYGY